MKKILILVLSADFPPYDKMIHTAEETWDSVSVENVDTVYYCGQSEKKSNGRIIYLPVEESLYRMGKKLILAFEWALANKSFDYIARPHSCIYVDKRQLVDYVEELPANNVFAGPRVTQSPEWIWGGLGFILSRDVVENVVANKELWDHSLMEDVALSYLVTKLGIPYTDGAGCSIDQFGESWLCLSYGDRRSKSFSFKDFADVKEKSNQFFYRTKQDGNREMDEFIMRNLYSHLK